MLRSSVNRALLLALMVLGGALCALGQPATTTVADTFYTAVGPSFCYGTFTLTWSDFYSQDGFLIKAGTSAPVTVSTMGTFSVHVVPTNTNTTPASGIYQVRYNLQPANCAPASEYWNVPSSGSSVDLNMVRTLPTPPPSLIPITSLYPPLSSATLELCSINYIIQWGTCGGGVTGITGSGTAGKLAKFTASTVIGNAAVGDITANFTGCSGTQYLGFDGNCHTVISQLTASAIIGLWSGCSGTQYLGADGNCHSAGGSGTVTSVALTMPTWLSVSGSPITSAGTLAVAPATGQTSHLVIGTCGTATTFTPCALTGAELPNPSATTLGGVESLAAVTHRWINQISTSGAPSSTQPACGDLSDSAAGCSATALPPNGAAGGDLSGTYPNPTVAQVNGAVVPASTNGVKTNSSRQVVAQAAADVVAEFTGCSGTQYLGADGNCHTAGGGFIQTLTAPSSGSFTARNFNTGTSVVTTQVNLSSPVTAITLKQHDPGGTDNIAALDKAKIASTFTVTIGTSLATAGNQCVVGIWLSDGGSPPNNITFGFQATNGMRGVYYTNYTTYSADTVSVNANALLGFPLIWLRIQETASARIYSISSDGVTFGQVGTESNTAHFTTANYGFAVDPRNASSSQPDCQETVYSFTESTP